MSVTSTEALVLATLASQQETDGSGVPLSKVTRTVSGDGQRLSQQVEITVAVETLAEEGHVERVTSDDGELVQLTDDGSDRAGTAYETLLDEDIEVVENGNRRELSLGDAASELSHSPVELAAACSEDGIYYRDEPVPTDELIGRDSEREQFEALLDRVQETRRGEVVILSGPGGIGKTTLADIVLEETPDSVDTIRTRCQEASGKPYQPFQDALDQLGSGNPFSSTELGADDAETYEAQQTALFHDVTELLVPDDGVRVLFLDDIDLADAASWTYLDYLCDRIQEVPLVVLGTHRPGTLPEDTPVSPGNEGETPVTRISLNGLDREDTERLIEQILSRRGIPEEFVEAVHKRTDGNPLFIETTVETLLDRNQLDSQLQWYPENVEDIDLPNAVRDTIVQRLDILDEDTHELLKWAAVAGESAPVTILQTLCEPSRERVAATVEMLIDAGIFIESETKGQQRVTLRSNVVREALLDDIEADERKLRHEAIAWILEGVVSLEQSRTQETFAEQASKIAYHHERAGDMDAAIEWYGDAARHATDVYAHETAVEQYHRILDIARSTDATEAMLSAGHRLAEIYLTTSEYEQASRYVRFVRERTADDQIDIRRKSARLAAKIAIQRSEFDEAIEQATAGLELTDERDVEHCHLLAVKAEAEWRQSDYDAAEETCEQFRELARELGQVDLQAEANEQMAMIVQERSEFDRAREFYELALEQAEADGDEHHAANIRNGLGIVASREGNDDEAREYYEQALDTFEEVGDRHQAAKLYNNLASIYGNEGDKEKEREYYERALETGKTVGDSDLTAVVHVNLGSIEYQRGDFDKGREYYEQALDTFEGMGDDHRAALAKLNLASDSVLRGRFDEARELTEEALETTRDIGDDLRSGSNLSRLGKIANERGAYEQAHEYYEEALAILEELGNETMVAMIRTNQAWTEYRQGDYRSAFDRVSDALETVRDQEDDSLIAYAQMIRGQALIGLGEYDEAQAALTEAHEKYETTGDPHDIGQVQRARGMLAYERGEYDQARELLETAVETFEDVSAVPDAARARRQLGRVAAVTGDSETAQDHWQRAVAMFEEVGAYEPALETLQWLVRDSRERDAIEEARAWCDRALSFPDQPDSESATRRREWFHDQRSELEH